LEENTWLVPSENDFFFQQLKDMSLIKKMLLFKTWFLAHHNHSMSIIDILQAFAQRIEQPEWVKLVLF
jgi:hypothetical protein